MTDSFISFDEAINKDDPRPCGNDKKFQNWTFRRPTGKGGMTEDKTIEVKSHPANGQRAGRTVGFVAEYDGVGFYDSDIVRLSKRLEAYHLGIKDEEFEKVLIIETTGSHPYGGRKGNEFGIAWRVGWVIKRLGFVYDEERKRKLTDVYYSEFDQEDPFVRMKDHFPNSQSSQDFIIHDDRKKATEKYAIIDWTPEREAALQVAADKLSAIRNGLDDALKEEKFFAALLDSKGEMLLESTYQVKED